MLITKRELKILSSPACHPQYTMTVPKGTRCIPVPYSGYVVDDLNKIQGGNRHDLTHYYVWIPEKEIEDFTP